MWRVHALISSHVNHSSCIIIQVDVSYLSFIAAPTGNLKHKDLKGQVVSSQVYVDSEDDHVDEEPAEGADEEPAEAADEEPAEAADEEQAEAANEEQAEAADEEPAEAADDYPPVSVASEEDRETE